MAHRKQGLINALLYSSPFISWIQLHAVATRWTSPLAPFQRSLPPIHRPWRGRRHGWTGRDPNQGPGVGPHVITAISSAISSCCYPPMRMLRLLSECERLSDAEFSELLRRLLLRWPAYGSLQVEEVGSKALLCISLLKQRTRRKNSDTFSNPQ